MSRDVRVLLQRTAETPTRPVGAPEVVGKAARQRLTMRATAGMAGLALLAVGSLAVVPTLADPERPGLEISDRPDPPAPPDGMDEQAGPHVDREDREERDPSEGGCAPPDLAPTYLPWLEEQERVPDPDLYFHGQDNAPVGGLVWLFEHDSDTAAGPATGRVMVSTPVIDEVEPPSDPPVVEVRGHTGELVWYADPGISNLRLSWHETPGPCGHIAIHLMLEGAPDFLDVSDGARAAPDQHADELRRAIEAEVVDIANSLITVDSSTFEPELPDVHWGILGERDLHEVEPDLDLLIDLFTPDDPVGQGLAPTAEQRAEGWRSTAQVDATWAERLNPYVDHVCAWALEVAPRSRRSGGIWNTGTTAALRHAGRPNTTSVVGPSRSSPA